MRTSPGVYRSMGYIEEEVHATRYLLSKAGMYPGQTEAFAWPRNGLASILVHFPFVASAHLVFGADSYFEDWVLSFEPILFTAGTLAILFLWIRRITGSEGWAFLLASPRPSPRCSGLTPTSVWKCSRRSFCC